MTDQPTEPQHTRVFIFGDSAGPDESPDAANELPRDVLRFLSGEELPLTTLDDAKNLLAALKVEFDAVERYRATMHNNMVKVSQAMRQRAGDAVKDNDVPHTPAQDYARGYSSGRYAELAWAAEQVADAITRTFTEAQETP